MTRVLALIAATIALFGAATEAQAGTPVPLKDQLVDDDGRDVAEGSIGEVWVRGPNVVNGYWNRPDATAEAFTDGWFHTGDLGYRSAEGFYYVVVLSPMVKRETTLSRN